MSAQATAITHLFRSRVFDHFFVWGIAIIGIISAYLVYFNIVSFFTIFILDIYLLGYHHVISTFTRFSYDKHSLIENRKLLLYSPVLVIFAVAFLYFQFGLVGISTVYLHWQWYHYTRQSEGLSKAFGIKTKNKIYSPNSPERALFYLTPITTFATMSSRQPDSFLGMGVYTIPVPQFLIWFLCSINIALFFYWLVKQIRALVTHETSFTYFLYFLSHHSIYLVAYVFIKDITTGWLAINIWHNLQYISFVWYCNANEHKKGINKSRPIISWLSQERNTAIYFLFCFTLSFAIYSFVEIVLSEIIFEQYAIIATVVVYTSINFHHYIVDSIIWKLRKPKLNKLISI